MFWKKKKKRDRDAGDTDRPDDQEQGEELPDDDGGWTGETVILVRDTAQARDTPSWHGSWERLSDKVALHLTRHFGKTELPYTLDFDDLFCSVVARMVRDVPNLELKGRRAFWAWVKTLAEHQIADFWRRHNAQRRGGGKPIEQQFDESGQDLISGTADPDAQSASMIVRLHELERVEQECVDRLSREEAKKIYTLRRVMGYSFEEIADQIGHSRPDSVRLIYHRAKKKVRACLLEKLDGYDEPRGR